MMAAVQMLLVLLLCVALGSALGYNQPFVVRSRHPTNPRCSSASKPCRTRAIMRADFLPAGSREIESPSCSCPPSLACSEDWEANRDRVITRELVTNGNISMTFSMMFCQPIQPQSRCQPGQVALQLSGWTPMPTEVDFINCACPEHRPLVLHTITTGSDHRQYHAYVCANHKRRCKRRRSNPDTCMETDPRTHTVTYPCKCTSFTSCQSQSATSPFRYICKRSRPQ